MKSIAYMTKKWFKYGAVAAFALLGGGGLSAQPSQEMPDVKVDEYFINQMNILLFMLALIVLLVIAIGTRFIFNNEEHNQLRHLAGNTLNKLKPFFQRQVSASSNA